jgi:hypothetical protein
MIVNPGGVGLPGYDGQMPVPYKVEVGTPGACYAILERTRVGWSTAIRYVPYESAAAAEMARSRGWPVWASALATVRIPAIATTIDWNEWSQSLSARTTGWIESVA